MKIMANIYDTDTSKAAIRRFKTTYHQLNQFDDNTQKYLKNLNNKFDKTIEYYKNPQIHRTNNKIEGYFKITLPNHIKKNISNKKRTNKMDKTAKNQMDRKKCFIQ